MDIHVIRQNRIHQAHPWDQGQQLLQVVTFSKRKSNAFGLNTSLHEFTDVRLLYVPSTHFCLPNRIKKKVNSPQSGFEFYKSYLLFLSFDDASKRLEFFNPLQSRG